MEKVNCKSIESEKISVFNYSDQQNQINILQSVFADEEQEIFLNPLGALKLAELLIENATTILNAQQTALTEFVDKLNIRQ